MENENLLHERVKCLLSLVGKQTYPYREYSSHSIIDRVRRRRNMTSLMWLYVTRVYVSICRWKSMYAYNRTGIIYIQMENETTWRGQRLLLVANRFVFISDERASTAIGIRNLVFPDSDSNVAWLKSHRPVRRQWFSARKSNYRNSHQIIDFWMINRFIVLKIPYFSYIGVSHSRNILKHW